MSITNDDIITLLTAVWVTRFAVIVHRFASKYSKITIFTLSNKPKNVHQYKQCKSSSFKNGLLLNFTRAIFSK